MQNDLDQYDVQLLHRITHSDTSALIELYDRYTPMAYSIIIRIVREKTCAEEILLNLFVNIWDRTEQYDAMMDKSPSSWLARTAHLSAIRWIQTKGRPVYPPETIMFPSQEYFISDYSESPERHVVFTSKQEAILIALTSLSKEFKELIEFAYFRGYTPSELAGHFKVSDRDIRTRIRTVMSILRQKMRHHLH